MPYSNNPDAYNPELLRQLAELVYSREAHYSDEEIMSILPEIRTRQQVSAMRHALRKSDLVQIVISPSRTFGGEELRELEGRVREMYGLVDCRLVPGRIEMLSEDLAPSIREVVVDEITKVAARVLDYRFGNMRESAPRLAIVYGFVTRKVADHLQAIEAMKRSKNGIVIAAHGVRSIEMDRFDANSIVHDVGRRFGCKYMCMALPLLVRKTQLPSLREMPLVGTVLDILDKELNMALISLASRHQQTRFAAAPQKSLQNELAITKADEKAVSGALATIGGNWFDSEGKQVDYHDSAVAGLQLDHLRHLVNSPYKERRPVILAAGCDCTRIPGIAIALKQKLANIWIGDSASASILVGDRVVERSDIRWSEHEKAILDKLQNRRFVS